MCQIVSGKHVVCVLKPIIPLYHWLFGAAKECYLSIPFPSFRLPSLCISIFTRSCFIPSIRDSILSFTRSCFFPSISGWILIPDSPSNKLCFHLSYFLQLNTRFSSITNKGHANDQEQVIFWRHFPWNRLLLASIVVPWNRLLFASIVVATIGGRIIDLLVSYYIYWYIYWTRFFSPRLAPRTTVIKSTSRYLQVTPTNPSKWNNWLSIQKSQYKAYLKIPFIIICCVRHCFQFNPLLLLLPHHFSSCIQTQPYLKSGIFIIFCIPQTFIFKLQEKKAGRRNSTQSKSEWREWMKRKI